MYNCAMVRKCTRRDMSQLIYSWFSHWQKPACRSEAKADTTCCTTFGDRVITYASSAPDRAIADVRFLCYTSPRIMLINMPHIPNQ